MKKRRCYIYTRVSTSMQVEGYSLEAQKERLRKYADFQEMVIVGEYSDEGKSGKSIEGRQEFMQMLRDIEEGKDRVEFVLVYKLSRFGRNAADVLNSLQRMQDFGVNLICVEDGIDSSKDSGKLMISVLSAVAEIERENILVQTMEGRRQKARDGKWNGGFAPYGYKLLNGELEIAEDEAEIIRIIFDKYIHTNMGVNGIAAYLNEHGYKKKKRQNNTLDAFATSFIKGVLDNPIYCGKLAFGRRKTERVPGKRNEFRIVKQDSYILSDGIHEAIISEDDWNLAKQKRNINGVKHEKIHSLEHEHILSGILKCPICGKGMYGNVNRKKKKDGTFYKDYFYYACKHRYYVNGHKCDYRKQWNEEKVNDAVAEVIKKLVNNPKFEAAIRAKINSKIDTGELETEHENLKKQLRQVLGAKNRLGQQMDNLDISDKMYDRKYQDMQDRLNGLYDEIERLESLIDDIVSRKEYIRQQKISEDGVYQYLLYFDKLYDKFTDMEKKEFMNSFVERVDIYEDEQPNGRFLKHIKFKFPVFFDGEEIQELSWDNETTVEEVASVENVIKECEYVLLQLEVNQDANEKIVDMANKYGCKVIMNTAPYAPMTDEFLSECYMVTPNEVEAEEITGVEVKDLDSAKQAAAYFREKGVTDVVITLGSRGVFVSSKGKEIIVPAYKVDAIDTTGAGDAFNGGLLAALSEGKELWEAVRFANGLAALSVQRLGTTPAMPTREEIDKFLAEHE